MAASLGRQITGSKPKLKSPQAIISFLLATGPLACLIGAWFSIFAISANQILEPSEFLKSGFTWRAGDAMGIVIMTPITLMILPETRENWKGRALKLVTPSILLALLTQIAFSQAISSDTQKRYLTFLKSRKKEHKESQILLATIQKYRA